LRKREDLLANDCRHGDLNPFRLRALVIGAVALGDTATQAQGARDSLTLCNFRFTEVRRSLVGRVAQHRPRHRTLPPSCLLARWHAAIIQQTGNRADADSASGVALIDHADDGRFGFDDLVVCSGIVGLAHVTIAVRCAAQNADLSLLRPMTLSAT